MIATFRYEPDHCVSLFGLTRLVFRVLYMQYMQTSGPPQLAYSFVSFTVCTYYYRFDINIILKNFKCPCTMSTDCAITKAEVIQMFRWFVPSFIIFTNIIRGMRFKKTKAYSTNLKPIVLYTKVSKYTYL